ncbi:DUF2480 family protein [Marinilongibacter aquaticus]|uniref:DUF2480 family protein n=1 Tax=Marinilongibacter aquaticus TaxID=2975157 RepID=UPI0021BD6AB8|nr:DUF2480 family protein [Marinilongibacter aquaticus]UBM60435.1 DUF2480 family protein [Marinilongibacter aquaticus]
MEGEIINRVANSGLVTLDLENYYPEGDRVAYDLKDNLFMELILKEKDFRDFLKTHDWEQYKGKHVAIFCSTDAIVPTWAYMLLGLRLNPVAKTVYFGSLEELEKYLFTEKIEVIDLEPYRDARVVVKGCSKLEVPAAAYVQLARKLQPLVKSLMFGEPCSTVPLYKKPKN